MPYLEHGGTLAFAHRGGNTAAAENTIAAFSHATSLGYRYLETDVHLTKDGALVAFHDSGLGRVAGMEEKIGDQTLEQLRSVDLGSGQQIPTLDELLETFPDARFNIDPKSDASVEPLALALQHHGAIDRVGIGSFSDARLRLLRERLGPRLCASPGPLGVARLAALIRLRRRLSPNLSRGFACVQIPSAFRGIQLDATLVDGFKALGLQVHVWTINSAAEMHTLLDMGVDGLMTDETVLLRSVLLERGVWSQ